MKMKRIITLLSLSLALAGASGYTLPELHSEYADLAFVTTNTSSYFPTTNGLIELKHNVPFSREVDPSNTWDGVGTDILRWNVGTASGFLANMSGMLERFVLTDVTRTFEGSWPETNLCEYVKDYDVLHDILTGVDTNITLWPWSPTSLPTIQSNFCATLSYRLTQDHLDTWLRVKDLFDKYVMGNFGDLEDEYGEVHFYSQAGSTRFPFDSIEYENTILPEGKSDKDYLDIFVRADYIWPVPIRFMKHFDTYNTWRDVIHDREHFDKLTAFGREHCRLGALYYVFGEFLKNKDFVQMGAADAPWAVPDGQDTFYLLDSLTNAFVNSRLARSNAGPVPSSITNAMCSYHSKTTRLDYDRLATAAQLASMIDRKFFAASPVLNATNFSADVQIQSSATNIVDVPVVFSHTMRSRSGVLSYYYKMDEGSLSNLHFNETNETTVTSADPSSEPVYHYFAGKTTRTAGAVLVGQGSGNMPSGTFRRIDPTGRQIEIFIQPGSIARDVTYGVRSINFISSPIDGTPTPNVEIRIVPVGSGVLPVSGLQAAFETPAKCSGRAFVKRDTHSDWTRKYGMAEFSRAVSNEYMLVENLGIAKECICSSLISRCLGLNEQKAEDLYKYMTWWRPEGLDFDQEWEISNADFVADRRTRQGRVVYMPTSGKAITNINNTINVEMTNALRKVAKEGVFPVEENYDGARDSDSSLVNDFLSDNEYCIVGTDESVRIYPFIIDETGGYVRVRLYDSESLTSDPIYTRYGGYTTYFSVGYWDVGLEKSKVTTSGEPKRAYGRIGAAYDLKLKFKNLTTTEE